MKIRATKWLILRYLSLSLFAQRRALRLVGKHAGAAYSSDDMNRLQRLLRSAMTHSANGNAVNSNAVEEIL